MIKESRKYMWTDGNKYKEDYKNEVEENIWMLNNGKVAESKILTSNV